MPRRKRQLERGARTVEVLKQGQYQPMPVEQQVMIIYAVTNGFIDDVPVSADPRVGEGLPRVHGRAVSRRSASGIRTEKVLSKEIEADLKRAHRGVQEDGVRGTPTFTAASL